MVSKPCQSGGRLENAFEWVQLGFGALREARCTMGWNAEPHKTFCSAHRRIFIEIVRAMRVDTSKVTRDGSSHPVQDGANPRAPSEDQ